MIDTYFVLLRGSRGDVVIASVGDMHEARQLADSAAKTHGGTYSVARVSYTTGNERWAEWQVPQAAREA